MGGSAPYAQMLTPDLSRLSLNRGADVGQRLMEFLVAEEVAKNSQCSHDDPKMQNENSNENCGVDGYLMFREVTADTETDGKVPPFYKPFDVKVDVVGSAGDPPLTKAERMQPIYGVTVKEKQEYMDNTQKQWMLHTFNKLCHGKILWERYAEELVDLSDWFLFATSATGKCKGQLFVGLANTPERKQKLGLPHQAGIWLAPCLYISLICAACYGTYMMEVAKKVAAKLQCKYIVLASLDTSASFYYALGYRFVRRDGEAVPEAAVESWSIKDEKGRTKFDLEHNPAPVAGGDGADDTPEPPGVDERGTTTGTEKRGREEDDITDNDRAAKQQNSGLLSLFTSALFSF